MNPAYSRERLKSEVGKRGLQDLLLGQASAKRIQVS